MKPDTTKRIASVRKLQREYDEARAAPREEWPGDRTMFLLNHGCCLGGYASPLADEIERLDGEVVALRSLATRLRDALEAQASESAYGSLDDDASVDLLDRTEDVLADADDLLKEGHNHAG